MLSCEADERSLMVFTASGLGAFEFQTVGSENTDSATMWDWLVRALVTSEAALVDVTAASALCVMRAHRASDIGVHSLTNHLRENRFYQLRDPPSTATRRAGRPEAESTGVAGSVTALDSVTAAPYQLRRDFGGDWAVYHSLEGACRWVLHLLGVFDAVSAIAAVSSWRLSCAVVSAGAGCIMVVWKHRRAQRRARYHQQHND